MTQLDQDEAAPAVLRERRDGVLVISLNRPRVRNALNLAVTRGVAEGLDLLDADADLSAAVITGSKQAFSSGMDLKAFLAGEPVWAGEEDDRGLRRIVTRPARKPVIAALEGFAVAGGLELALSCDILVAGRSTKLGIPEATRSLVAAGGALRALPRRIGPGAAMKLAMTGELITAERGFEIGLIDELADDGGALDAALALAATIGRNGPLALIASKEVLNRQFEWSDEEFWARQKEITDPVFESADAAEGAKAFSEKRDPVWTGS